MLVKNSSKNKVIGADFKVCDDKLSKFIGLMFSNKQSNSLVFRFSKERKIHLHMLFVFYPIDVLFLDKNKIVVDKKTNFKPFTFYKSERKAMYVIEMPNGIIKKTKTEIGDKIRF